MDILARLMSAGFDRVIVLDGEECGEPAKCSVLLAIWTYEAHQVADDGAVIHPYYPASQKAYEAASAIAAEYAQEGAELRDDIRLKPIFARLPGFSQGRNTLSYIDGVGSRFHVQTLTITPGLPATHHLEASPHELNCGACRSCVAACPTNALENGVFHRERCVRNWQLSGKPVPVEVRKKMGNLLLGCDVCQMVCPKNQQAGSGNGCTVALEELMAKPRETAAALRPVIGANLAIPNRLLSQACLIAGCSHADELTNVLERLVNHPSPTVAEHASWALNEISP